MKFLQVLLFCTVLVVLMGDLAMAQKKRRGRKGKGSDQCHQKEAMKCFDKLTALGKGDDPTSLIASSQGLNRICKTIKDDTMKCVKSFFKKCGTPLHREISDLVMETVLDHVSKFCDNSQKKSRFLKHSPCYHTKVLRTQSFKNTCNNPFLFVVGKININSRLAADSVHETLCCGFNVWHECTSDKVKEECSAEGSRIFGDFHNSTLAPITDLLCPADVFPATSSACRKVMNSSKPKAGAKPSENVFSRLIKQMIPFLFSK